MKFTVANDDETPIEFECADTISSRWVCSEILLGHTYPFLPFVDDVQVVLDVGANYGATSVHFARHYPNARVEAFEPAREPFTVLERNVREYTNVHAHRIGLHSIDQVVPLYKGDGDSILGSIYRRKVNLADSEPVELRAAGAWARENEIGRVDLLKIDVEGCEVDVLESLAFLIPSVKALYIEYDSRLARRQIARMLDQTHEIYTGVMFLDQGECIYLRKDVASLDAATEHLRQVMTDGIAAARAGAG